MKTAFKNAINFIKGKAIANGKVSHIGVELFARKLFMILCNEYHGLWYPECKYAHRHFALADEPPPPEMILRACDESGVTIEAMGLPPDLTVWLDPLGVWVRYEGKNVSFPIASCSGYQEDTEESVAAGRRVYKYLTASGTHSATSSDWSSTASSDMENKGGVRRRYKKYSPASGSYSPTSSDLSSTGSSDMEEEKKNK